LLAATGDRLLCGSNIFDPATAAVAALAAAVAVAAVAAVAGADAVAPTAVAAAVAPAAAVAAAGKSRSLDGAGVLGSGGGGCRSCCFLQRAFLFA